MHIVHYNLTTTTKEGGVETFVWELARAQARQGQRITIIGGAGAVRRPAPGVAVRTVPFIDRERFAVGPLRRAYALRKLAERLSMVPAAWPLLRDAELVHIHKPYDLVLAPWLRRRGVPLIYHGHGEDFFRGDRRLMRDAAVLLACSGYNAATLEARYGRRPTIVYNGVDTDHFQPQPPDMVLREHLAPRARHVVMLPGRMMPWKGQRYAIEALALLGDPGVRLVIIGGGEVRADLEVLAAALGVREQIHFTGVVSHAQMPRYLACADLVLGTSYTSETFGMLLAEALACERPVIASTWRGYDDVVQDGITGARFATQDAGSLASVVRRLLDAPDERARLAVAGRAQVRERFTWERIAARVASAYPEVRQ